MVKRTKKTAILIVIVIFSLNVISKVIPKTESIDPFFTLVAYAKNPTEADYFNLIREQLWRIGVNLDILRPGPFQWDLSGRYDLEIVNIFNSSISSPFLWNYYSENGTYNLYGYDETLDWEDELNTGKNEWFIETGLEMIANNSERAINHCWEWQNYMLDKVLPCLPMFVQKNNSEYFQVLYYNLKETHPVIGNRDMSPGNIEFTKGLAIRKAITYAINREEIRRVVLGDDYKVIDHPINPFMDNWCNPNVVRYCHDLYVARRFFEMAGYSLCGEHYTGKYTDPFPNFTDWETVCSRNEPINSTIDVAGLSTFLSLGVLSLTSVSWLLLQFRKKRRKTE